MRVTRRGVTWEVDEPEAVKGWFWATWEADEWEPETLDTIDRFVSPGSTYVDIGAWIGPTAMWAGRNAARVIALEPDPVANRFLVDNVAANKMWNVGTVQAALTPKTGPAYLAPKDEWGDSMSRLANVGIEVHGIAIADLFESSKITDCSLVKMDIEGGESVVLESVAPFLAERGIPLLVAMHEPWWQKPVEPAWFDGFSSVTGNLDGWNSVLALP